MTRWARCGWPAVIGSLLPACAPSAAAPPVVPVIEVTERGAAAPAVAVLKVHPGAAERSARGLVVPKSWVPGAGQPVGRQAVCSVEAIWTAGDDGTTRSLTLRGGEGSTRRSKTLVGLFARAAREGAADGYSMKKSRLTHRASVKASLEAVGAAAVDTLPPDVAKWVRLAQRHVERRIVRMRYEDAVDGEVTLALVHRDALSRAARGLTTTAFDRGRVSFERRVGEWTVVVEGAQPANQPAEVVIRATKPGRKRDKVRWCPSREDDLMEDLFSDDDDDDDDEIGVDDF